MASNVTRDHHNLRRNLKLNDNYISNDGGDEGISIADDGGTSLTFAGTTTDALSITSHALTTGKVLKIDVNDSLTTSATKSLFMIDYDKAGVTASGQLSNTTGLHISLEDAATNDVSGAVAMLGMNISIDSANAAGNIYPTGLLVNVAIDGVGDAANTYGMKMRVMDGGTDIIMLSSADAEDYCSISTTTNGATTIATVDDGNAEAAHLTFDIQGDTIFKGDIADGTSTEVARIDSSASSLLIASTNQLQFNDNSQHIASTANDMTITSGRHLTIDVGGDIILDAAGNNITLQANGSTYTPSAASDATTKAYVDANVYHFIRGGYQNTGTSKNFIPMAGNEDLREGTSMSNFGEKYSFICPYDGTFEKAYARSEINCGNSIFGFHHSAGAGDEAPSDTATSTVTVTMGTDDTSYEFDFTGVTNTFSKGDIIAFSFDPTLAPNDTHFMIVLKFDVTT
jgi:hypothetical protein